jgi:hypothetical protein
MLTLDSHRTLLGTRPTQGEDESHFAKTITEETQGPMLVRYKDDTLMQFRNDGDDNFSKIVQMRKKNRSSQKVTHETEQETSGHETSTYSVLTVQTVPSEWDYVILPRKINLENVPLPTTVLKEDYFESVKNMVRLAMILFLTIFLEIQLEA